MKTDSLAVTRACELKGGGGEFSVFFTYDEYRPTALH